MLVFNLKKEWFEKIKSGEKTTEYRLLKPYWIKRINNVLLEDCGVDLDIYMANMNTNNYLMLDTPCKFVLGYTDKFLIGNIKEISIIDKKDSDLRNDKSDIDKVFALHFKLLQEDLWKFLSM